MNNFIRLLPLLIMFILSAALALGLFNKEEDSPFVLTNVGKPLADFEIPSIGKETSFSPKLFGGGKVTVVNVFASWCVPCAAEHSLLMELAKKVNIYGIAWKDNPQKVFEFLKQRGNPFQQIGVDAEGKTTVALALSGVPETFVLDKGGNVVMHYKEPLTDDIITRLIIPMVEKLNSENAVAN